MNNVTAKTTLDHDGTTYSVADAGNGTTVTAYWVTATDGTPYLVVDVDASDAGEDGQPQNLVVTVNDGDVYRATPEA